MSEDEKQKPSRPPERTSQAESPIEDVKKGLGLLFRAAKTAVDQLPSKKIEDVTEKIEDVVMSSAREVGRAIENVTQTIDKQIFHHDKSSPAQPPPEAPKAAAPKSEPPAPAAPEAKADGEEPKGPRVG